MLKLAESGAILQDYLDDYFYTSWYTGNRNLIQLDHYGFPTASNFELNPKSTDNCGTVDFQGIPWGNKAIGKRKNFRLYRLHTYSLSCNHSDWSPEELSLDTVQVAAEDSFYEFQRFLKNPNCLRNHHHLCKSVKVVGEHSVIYVSNNSIRMENTLHDNSVQIIDLKNNILQKKAISCLDTTNAVGCLGTLYGQYCIFNFKNGSFSTRKLSDDSINHIQLFSEKKFILGCNDGAVYVEDVQRTSPILVYRCSNAVNCVQLFDETPLALVCTDSKDAMLIDIRSNSVSAKLPHSDSVLTGSWHPNGNILATGGQDTTAKVWDIRALGKSFRNLGSQMSAVTNLCFSPLGESLAVTEQADFVQLFDTKLFNTSQVIDFFGEIAGTAYSSSGDSLFIGVDDPMLGGILEFRRPLQHPLSFIF